MTLYLNPGPGADVSIPDTIALAKLASVQFIKDMLDLRRSAAKGPLRRHGKLRQGGPQRFQRCDGLDAG